MSYKYKKVLLKLETPLVFFVEPISVLNDFVKKSSNMDRIRSRLKTRVIQGDFEDLNHFLDYLVANVSSAPFKPKEIATRFHLDRFVVQDFFEIVRKNFALLKALEQQREWGALMGTSSNQKEPNQEFQTKRKAKYTQKQSHAGNHRDFEISLDELKTLQLIQVITTMQPLSANVIKSKPKFASLCKKFGILFDEVREGIVLSEVGLHVVSEYQAYKKINEMPDSISYKSYTFLLESEIETQKRLKQEI